MLRKIVTISAAGIALATLGPIAQAATTSATASATVLTPIAISTTTNMSFGDLYADNVSSGTVVLAVDGSRTTTGGASLGTTPGTAAVFAVTGNVSATYVVTLPSTDVTLTSGANTMIVNTFSDNSLGALDGTGNDSFNVGATLNVGISQAPGAYSGSFNVTVNYN
ncbi:MAG: DUF4402 domain-containing protein [Gammaproteobacteria bacterium]|nr:DUF4402 domain-containing protein [Gammaproteobacteria bacterium]MDH5651622.1 DUF4402 domain-containing protein [Gammaproteobacteria bacterium]